MLASHQEVGQLDSRMRASLADSLGYIFEKAAEALDLNSERCDHVLRQINSKRTDPGVFARYYDLVFAINDQDLTLARRLVDEICEKADATVNFDIVPYCEYHLGDDFERFPRLIFAGYSDASPLATPAQALFKSHFNKLKRAIAIIREVDETIAREVEALISRIVVASSNRCEPQARSFGGVTSFMTWGAIFVNARNYASIYQVVEFLVHELTHCVLFGLSCNEPLVLNNASERYPSPLRSDLRPMDGVYHATIVSARLAFFMKRWRESAPMTRELEAWLDAQIETNQQAFLRGSTIVLKYAELSVLAKNILQRARFAL